MLSLITTEARRATSQRGPNNGDFENAKRISWETLVRKAPLRLHPYEDRPLGARAARMFDSICAWRERVSHNIHRHFLQPRKKLHNRPIILATSNSRPNVSVPPSLGRAGTPAARSPFRRLHGRACLGAQRQRSSLRN